MTTDRKFRRLRFDGLPEEQQPKLLTTENEFNKPRPGDVRIEEGVARVNGEVMHRRFRHKPTGKLLTSVQLQAKHDLKSGKSTVPTVAEGPDWEVEREEQRSHKYYRWEERPARGEHGFYIHRDDHPDAVFLRGATEFDDEGFALDPHTGERMPRFTEDHRWFWAPHGEHPELEKAMAHAAKLVKE